VRDAGCEGEEDAGCEDEEDVGAVIMISAEELDMIVRHVQSEMNTLF
jgi:hypothetical protein